MPQMQMAMDSTGEEAEALPAMYSEAEMTIGEFRKATKDVPDNAPIVYAHSWHSVRKVATGSYLGSGGMDAAVIIGGYCDTLNKHGNRVLHEDADDRP